MNKKSLFLVSFLLVAILAACNMPAGEISSIADVARQTQQARLSMDAQPQNTGNSQSGSQPTFSSSSNDLVITDVQVDTRTFYYASDACGPREVTVTAKVTGSAAITHVGVQRLSTGDQIGPNGGEADNMSPIGNDRYAFVIDSSKINTTTQDNYSIALTIYAEDADGNQVATGEWGDGVGDGHLWTLNSLQLQIPALRLEQCIGSAIEVPTTQPQVEMPTSTPVPVIELPTNTPVPQVQTKSGYVELRDWYAAEDVADIDFDGVPQLAYTAATSDYPNHGLGEYVAQGNVTNMTLTAGASYDSCRATQAWNTSVAPVSAGQTYCFVADNKNGTSYGYFHIDKIENQGSEIDNWVIGISYTVWIPGNAN